MNKKTIITILLALVAVEGESRPNSTFTGRPIDMVSTERKVTDYLVAWRIIRNFAPNI